jgi:hypothetical protein
MKNTVNIVISWSIKSHSPFIMELVNKLLLKKWVTVIDYPQKIVPDIDGNISSEKYLDRLTKYFYNIDLSDTLIAANGDGYIWSGMFSEILYAVVNWKNIYLQETTIADGSSWKEEIKMLIDIWKIKSIKEFFNN